MSMMGGDELALHATLDDDVSPELRDIRDELRSVGRQAETTGRQASSSGRGFATMGKAGRLAGTLIKVGFVAALGAGYAAVKLLTSSFGEAREAQKVGAATTQIIKATGGAAKISTKQVGNLAGRLSAMAGVDDELIQSGANLLLTFKNVRNEAGKGGKVFNRATAAAVDLSAAGFGSIESGSKMLGKALNDPLKGITALSRAGVTFTAEQQATIKTLVGQNDLLGAQKIILGEVEHQVGGVAKATATWGDKAKVSWGNAQEALGTALLPTLDAVSRWFVEKGAPQLDKWVGIFQDRGIPAIERFLKRARPLANEVLPAVGDALGTIRDVVADVAPKLQAVFRGFNNLPGWAKSALVIGAGGAVVAKKLGVLSVGKKAAETVLKVATKAKPLPVFVTNPGFGGKPGGVPGSSSSNTRTTAERTGASAAGGAVSSRAKQIATAAKSGAKYTPVVGTELLAVGYGAKVMGDYLASRRPEDVSGAQKARYAKSAAAYGTNLPKVAPVTITLNPGNPTGPPLIATNILYDPKVANAIKDNVDRPLSVATTTARELGTSLGDVGKTRVEPKVAPIGFPPAQEAANNLRGALNGISGSPFTARVNLDATAAWNELSRLRAAGQFIGPVAATAPTGGNGRNRAYGGRVIAGRSYVVGERRAEMFTPDRSGWIKPRATAESGTGGGIHIAAGAIVVHAEGAAANVDVEQAVADALERFLREREERA